MISRFSSWLNTRSRGGKDSGSVSKRARAVSYDSGRLSGSNVNGSPARDGSRKENASSSHVAYHSSSGEGRSVTDADRPPLKEVGASGESVVAPSFSLSLEARQQEEKDFIRNNDTAEAHVWYLVDVRWLQEWKHFVTRNAPLPGPIDNSRLLDRDGLPRRGLQPVEDYRGVNSAIWAYWHQCYGGGPAVLRRQLDLYGEPVRDKDDISTTNSSETGSERQRHDLPLPGSAAASGGRSETSRSSRSTARSARHRDDGRSEEASSRGRPGERPSSQAAKGRSGASSRTLSLPASRAHASEDDPLKPPCCDKCDGPHATDDCPHFKRPREKHADAWTSYGKTNPSRAGGGLEMVHVVRNARVVSQPGDGSCLFHSMSYGLNDRSTASSLRREICRYVENNPDVIIADTALKDWIKYDSGGTVQSYAQKMATGNQWGGGIEMAALTKMRSVNVHVYEKCEEGYKRISCFDNPNAQRTISVLYQGRMHYDAIDV